MRNDKSPPGNTQKAKKIFKRCPGHGCKNIGRNALKIIYINKIGWFCDKCKIDLVTLKLAEEVVEQSSRDGLIAIQEIEKLNNQEYY
jgi:hypothetical protein